MCVWLVMESHGLMHLSLPLASLSLSLPSQTMGNIYVLVLCRLNTSSSVPSLSLPLSSFSNNIYVHVLCRHSWLIHLPLSLASLSPSLSSHRHTLALLLGLPQLQFFCITCSCFCILTVSNQKLDRGEGLGTRVGIRVYD